MKSLRGAGVAIVTPFNEDGSVDFKGFEKLLEHNVNGGIDYIVVQGTTGESATLTQDEKEQVLAFAIDVINGRVPVVFGHGGNNTAALVEGLKHFNLEGVTAILSASPYYNKPTQEGIYQHYKALAESTELPIILYNVPGRTSSNMAPETTLRLARDFDNIVAIKEASGDLDQMGQILKNRPEDFIVLSGDDNLVWPQLALGADGVISVVANAFPRAFRTMVADGLNGNIAMSRKLHNQFMDVIPLLFAEGNPAGIKAVLKQMNICDDQVRLPLVTISDDLRAALALEIKKAELV